MESNQFTIMLHYESFLLLEFKIIDLKEDFISQEL